MLPEVPVMVRVNVPVTALEATARASVEDALPPAPGVTLAGENVAVTPLGTPEMLNPVAALKPLRLVTVTVVVPLPPWGSATEFGETPREKSWEPAVTVKGIVLEDPPGVTTDKL